jgi:hypothetical protein
VDILNTIGVSMMLMGMVCWLAATAVANTRIEVNNSAGNRPRFAGAAILAALAISLITPMVWTNWRPHWLPWPIESYFDGVHNLGIPQAGLFPIFPWAGFAFAGLATGFLLLTKWAREQEGLSLLLAGIGGSLLIALARWLDRRPQVYPLYDFWHTSPNFFFIRVGLLLVILLAGYAWCRWGAGLWGFSPLIQLGQTSLLVYWVHMEFVYGRVSILRKHGMTVAGASMGLLVICLMMLAVSAFRTRMKNAKTEMKRGKAVPAG